MPILVFFIFVCLVGVGILALGYGLHLAEARPTSRRRRTHFERRHGKKVRRRGVRCKSGG